MNPGIQRIEATLDQIGTQSISDDAAIVATTVHQPPRTAAKKGQPSTKSKSKMAKIEPFPLPKVSPASTSAAQEASQGMTPAVKPDAGMAKGNAVPDLVQPFPAQPVSSDLPPLPRTKPVSISSHRHAANPNLAVGLLKEVEAIVLGWKQDLEVVVQQIRLLYEEGPIVDGWLESHPAGTLQATPPNVSLLRHAEIEHLMEYVEQICRQTQITDESARTEYRLCGLDADGKLWSRPCPAEQVPYVSLALARYQKLRTLLARKQDLENRLTNLVQTLTVLHSQIRD